MIRSRGLLFPVILAASSFVLPGSLPQAQPAQSPDRHATLPAASPDGRHVAFVRDLPDHSAEMVVVDLDGSHERVLAHVQDGGAPFWASGGRAIAFDARAGDTVELRLVPRERGEPRTVVALRALTVAPSHDGRRIVWTQGGWTCGRMLVADVDGSHARALTDSTMGFFNMAWSPDDRTIAVTRRDTTGDLQIWTFDVRTGASRSVTAFEKSAGRPQWPAWSPDGKRLAVQAGRYDRQNPEKSEADIWVMNADGSDLRRITTRERPWMDETPSWMPDGKRIVFQSTRSGRFDVWIMNADGSGARQITH